MIAGLPLSTLNHVLELWIISNQLQSPNPYSHCPLSVITYKARIIVSGRFCILTLTMSMNMTLSLSVTETLTGTLSVNLILTLTLTLLTLTLDLDS